MEPKSTSFGGLTPELVGSVISSAHVMEGLNIERKCRDRAAKVCDGISSIRGALDKIRELASGIVETWNSIKDTPEVANGNLAEEILEPVGKIVGYATKTAPIFTINKASHIAPYDRNIEDMTELLSVIILHENAGRLVRQISETETMRRKPLFRELKRIYSSIISGSTSIMNGGYASVNVPKWYTDAVYGFVKSIVDDAKKGVKALKEVA